MKKPGEFKKQQKKHQNIQHNRDQLKLLKEEKIQEAELFILDDDGFKKVTIKPMTEYEDIGNVVYLQKGKNSTRLKTGFLYPKDGLVLTTKSGTSFKINLKDVYGLIIKEEMLKPSSTPEQ